MDGTSRCHFFGSSAGNLSLHSIAQRERRDYAHGAKRTGPTKLSNFDLYSCVHQYLLDILITHSQRTVSAYKIPRVGKRVRKSLQIGTAHITISMYIHHDTEIYSPIQGSTCNWGYSQSS